jgi:hypothetical protein
MRRLDEIAEEPAQVTEPAQEPLPRLVIGDPKDDDEFDEDSFEVALKLLEDAQEVMIYLQDEQVKQAAPIPVWNALLRAERLISKFLDSFVIDEEGEV